MEKEKIKKLHSRIKKEREQLYENYKEVINEYKSASIHGRKHILNVLYYATKLTEMIELDDESIEILIYSALYHDIGRTCENIDDTHGFKSFRIYRETKCPQNDYIKYLIEQHPIDDDEAFESVKYYDVDNKKAIKLLKIFKDCDGLDRIRCGDFDAYYLRLKESHQLINLSMICNVDLK